jgi:hypothetical protein
MATRIEVVFYSKYGHDYRLAEAVSAGAREVAGTVYQVAELVPEDILEKSGARSFTEGMIIVGVPFSEPRLVAMTEITGEDALRRIHDHRLRWVAAAFGERPGHRSLPR